MQKQYQDILLENILEKKEKIPILLQLVTFYKKNLLPGVTQLQTEKEPRMDTNKHEFLRKNFSDYWCPFVFIRGLKIVFVKKTKLVD